MKLAIMQPYFFPYIGYWQLMHEVDCFVIYDNIQYTKSGWINRNRIANGIITLPLKRDHEGLMICERAVDPLWDKKKMLRKIKVAYGSCPLFDDTYNLIKKCLDYVSVNLYDWLAHSITNIRKYIGIYTPMMSSSLFPHDPNKKGQERVLELCKHIGATEYINPVGGVSLYDREAFANHGIELQFLKTCSENYLSIIDVLMNSKDIGKYDII